MPGGHHEGCGAGCDHGAAGFVGEEVGLAYSLFQRIDMANLTCMNETVEESGKGVFKPWEDRLSRDKFVESDADEELLFNIPFTGNVKLKGLIVGGEDDDSFPAKVRIYKNRPNMTFDDTGALADQEFNLVRDTTCNLEYKVKVVTFSSVHHLTLHFPSNFGADQTKIFYIGLAGEFTKADRVGVVNAVYEARAIPEDHKARDREGMLGDSGPAF